VEKMEKTKRKIIYILEFISISAIIIGWFLSSWQLNIPKSLTNKGENNNDIKDSLLSLKN
jgi:hypothetical protein